MAQNYQHASVVMLNIRTKRGQLEAVVQHVELQIALKI